MPASDAHVMSRLLEACARIADAQTATGSGAEHIYLYTYVFRVLLDICHDAYKKAVGAGDCATAEPVADSQVAMNDMSQQLPRSGLKRTCL